ncbi:U4/U6 small nuclear ribonucleoprotein Prp4 (macronuclear) [Tetrahymena thermophila SB210]|uniref:U4/U6 small nuclear ribonucleoprotein Prp4 n=1 Tax=Tetrahymena thermophila (strain SB210) TaxID=312017 RepID=Q22LQ2_TETTS|nr:U4/U6 small nuclear ribonucleoprotein Prp4 [Tetrahymena thermophila SB210]EAR86214.1 U4/U6 small nuclear ribonucleoprotein Prp4 [Tetrahymena thermophila SB210]|eukprot:XP_976809.1 U4/U6 small nuclear ribonucleoprotein Prp4 [Tetrahymena thermophila SB210]
MSSDKQEERIYYGSLEEQERQRIIDEEKQKQERKQQQASQSAPNSSSDQQQSQQVQTGQLKSLGGKQLKSLADKDKSQTNVQIEVLELSEHALEEKRRHDENMRKLELQKKASTMIVPTNDKEVKYRLRQLGHPICYFGENNADRRERLKKVQAEYIMEHGDLPQFIKLEEKQKQNDENEHFYYPGIKELKEIREEIATYSLLKSSRRVYKSKVGRMEEDPLVEEKKQISSLNRAMKFDVCVSQFADSSIVLRGAFSPECDLLATAGGSGVSKIWNIPNSDLKCRLEGHLSKVHDIVWNPETGSMSHNSFGHLATGSSDTNIRLWTMDPAAELQKSIVLSGHEDRVNRLSFHQTGKYLFSTSHDMTWRFWDIERQKEIYVQTGHTKGVYANALHPDGSLIFTGDLQGYGMIWDLRTGKGILPFSGYHVKGILAADFSENGFQFVTGSEDNTLRVFDIRRRACMHTLPGHLKLISDVKFQKNGSNYFVSVSYDNTLKLWNAKDFSLAKTYKSHESKITSVTLDQSQKYFATTSLDRKWMLWEYKDF